MTTYDKNVDTYGCVHVHVCMHIWSNKVHTELGGRLVVIHVGIEKRKSKKEKERLE